MYPTICIGLVAVYFAYLNGKMPNDNCLKFSFLLLTIFLSLSYNWGPDVPLYHSGFNEINSQKLSIFDIDSLIDIRRNGEIGWTILNLLFAPIGFWGFRFVLFSLENYIIYRFVNNYVAKKWQWLSLFIYVFNASEFMVISSPMMRQFLAMCLVLWAFMFFDNKKYLTSLIIFIIAPFIHISSIICLVIVPLLFLKYEFPNVQKIGIILAFLLFVLFGAEFISPYLLLLMTDDFNFYEVYLDEGGANALGLTNILKMLVYLIMFLSINKLNEISRTIVAISFISVLFIPLISMSQLIVRLSYYFSIFTIAAIPLFFSQSSLNKVAKIGMFCFLIVLYLYGFWVHFTGPVYFPTMYEYHTLFEGTL